MSRAWELARFLCPEPGNKQEAIAKELHKFAAAERQDAEKAERERIVAYIRNEASIPANAFLKFSHASYLASVKHLADQIECFGPRSPLPEPPA